MKRIKFKKYAGFKIKGTVAQQPVNFESSHLDRAAWLTAEVESGGLFGGVMNYDGTGMTAGIHQGVAVYPRALADEKVDNDQGPLWKLLARMRSTAPDCLQLLHLFEKLWGYHQWYLDDAGVLRARNDGKPVSGPDIRLELTGNKNGCAPTQGQRKELAEEWVQTFHEAFKHPATFDAQNNWGVAHFTKRADRTKLRFCKRPVNKKKTIHDVLYGSNFHISHPQELPHFSFAIDLANAVFWSNTVNAPSAALKVLCKVVDSVGTVYTKGTGTDGFSRALIKALGTSSYGRWDDDIKNGRYQRTRKAAMDVWPEEFFKKDGIMPKDLEG